MKLKKRIAAVMLSGLSAICLSTGVIMASATDDIERISTTDLFQATKYSEIKGISEISSWYGMEGEKGVAVECKNSGARVDFKNVIDVTDFKKDEVLFEIAPIVNVRGSKEIDQIDVTLTDYDNPDNYIIITMKHSQWWYATTHFRVETPQATSAGLQWGYYNENSSKVSDIGMENLIGPFMGYTAFHYDEEGYNVVPLRVTYDHEEKAIYCWNGSGANNSYLVRDLDDSTNMGLGKEWEGFTSGRVKVSITAKGVTSSKATYVITQFFGVDLGSEYVEDEKAPLMVTQADKDPTILQGVVGVEYPLFDADVHDFCDGKITNITKTLIKPNGDTEVLTGDSFTPNVVGEYSLKYSCCDSSGNPVEKIYTVNVEATKQNIQFTFNGTLPTEASVGEAITLPTATVTGNIGQNDVNVSVINVTTGIEAEISNGQFIPSGAGEYKVMYSYADYIANVGKEEFLIAVSVSDAPIVTFWDMPTSVLSGHPFKFPELEAYDYTSAGQKQDAVVEYYVSYEEGVLGDKVDGVFTPDVAKGENVYISYKTYCNSTVEKAIVKTYTLNLIEMKQLSDNFEKRKISVDLQEDYIEFSTEKNNAGFSYLTPLPAKNFTFQFSIPTSLNKFSKFVITLKDSLDFSKEISLTIEKQKYKTKSLITYNGKTYEMSGSFDLPNYPFGFSISDDGVELSDANGTVICKLDKYSDGRAYDGFTDGKFYLDFQFANVTGKSGIRMTKILNQSIYGNYNRNDELVDFADRVAPSIIVAKDVAFEVLKSETVVVPTAFSVDAIDSYIEVFVKVSKDGKTLIDTVNIEKNELSFTASEIGRYVIDYTARDSSGNLATRRFSVYVFDVTPPTISVSGTVNEYYHIGDTLKIPQATVTDSESTYIARVFMVTPMGKMVEVENNYTFEKGGVYTLRYYAYDSNYNATFVDFRMYIQ